MNGKNFSEEASSVSIKAQNNNDFDYEFYTGYYKDLSHFSYKEALNHWQLYGQYEGRCASEHAFFLKNKISLKSLPNNFSVEIYLESNPDLKFNKYDAIIHYLKWGKKESRFFEPLKKLKNDVISWEKKYTTASKEKKQLLLAQAEIFYQDWNKHIDREIHDLKETQQWDDVISILNRYKSYQIHNLNVYLELSNAYRHIKNFSAALITLKNAKENGLKSLYFYESYIQIFLDKKFYKKAIKECQLALQLANTTEEKERFSELLTTCEQLFVIEEVKQDIHHLEAELIEESGLFDYEFYLSVYTDVDPLEIDPLIHFAYYGWKEERHPNAYFSVTWYAERYNLSADINPVIHYIKTGWFLLLDTSKIFCTQKYFETYKKQINDVIDPLAYFLNEGLKLSHTPFEVEPEILDFQIEYFFDLAMPIQTSELLLIGWCLNINHEIVDFFAVNNLIPGKLEKLPYYLYKRPDLQEHCARVGANYQEAGIILHLPHHYGMTDAKQIEIYAFTRSKQVLRLANRSDLHWMNNKEPPQKRIQRLLELFNLTQVECFAMLDQLLGPVISRLHTRTLQERLHHHPITKRENFGKLPTNPLVSVIVPIYGRYDFAMYQLADFSNDFAFSDGRIELLFVCDDPNIEADFLNAAHSWQAVYSVPFSIISYKSNLGYAGANNIAANQASAEILILLNSDALPTQPGWAIELATYLKNHPTVGAIGPMLLFYDGTVQHEGMEYIRDKNIWGGLWQCSHPRKGMLPNEQALQPHSIPATTGACLVTHKAIYQNLGGLSEEYILGDFEDSDYCLKVRNSGLDIHLLPHIRLYHVERQSQSLITGQWKEGLTIYNAWVHQKRWNKTIEALLAAE